MIQRSDLDRRGVNMQHGLRALFPGYLAEIPHMSNKAPRRLGVYRVQPRYPRCNRKRAVSQIFTLRKRSALEITDAELRLIASAAIIGDSNNPVNG